MDTEAAIAISLNGAPRDIPAGTSVAGLLGLVGLEPRKVAVERNQAIVPRSTYAAAVLQPGDQIEIVHFIGGG